MMRPRLRDELDLDGDSRSGRWPADARCLDAQNRNVLSARGYFEAFQHVRRRDTDQEQPLIGLPELNRRPDPEKSLKGQGAGRGTDRGGAQPHEVYPEGRHRYMPIFAMVVRLRTQGNHTSRPALPLLDPPAISVTSKSSEDTMTTVDNLPATLPADQIVSGALQLFDVGTIMITERAPDGNIMAALLGEEDENLAVKLPMRTGETAGELIARFDDDDAEFCAMSETLLATRDQLFACARSREN